MVMTGAAGRKMRKKRLKTCCNMSPSFGSYIYYHTTLLLLCFQIFNKTAELISKKVQKSGPSYTQITECKSIKKMQKSGPSYTQNGYKRKKVKKDVKKDEKVSRPGLYKRIPFVQELPNIAKCPKSMLFDFLFTFCLYLVLFGN